MDTALYKCLLLLLLLLILLLKEAKKKMGDGRTSIKREDGECSLKKCDMMFKA